MPNMKRRAKREEVHVAAQRYWETVDKVEERHGKDVYGNALFWVIGESIRKTLDKFYAKKISNREALWHVEFNIEDLERHFLKEENQSEKEFKVAEAAEYGVEIDDDDVPHYNGYRAFAIREYDLRSAGPENPVLGYTYRIKGEECEGEGLFGIVGREETYPEHKLAIAEILYPGKNLFSSNPKNAAQDPKDATPSAVPCDTGQANVAPQNPKIVRSVAADMFGNDTPLLIAGRIVPNARNRKVWV
jgi:hypothetical protein